MVAFASDPKAVAPPLRTMADADREHDARVISTQAARIAELECRLILDRDLVRDLQTDWRPSKDGLKQWEQRLNEVLRKSEQK